MHHSCLCDSAENISSKSHSQVVGENVYGPSVCRFFKVFNMLKTIWKPMYFMITNTKIISRQCYFKIETTQFIFYANSLIAPCMNVTLVWEYFSLNLLVFLTLSWCFNEVMHIEMCIGWLIVSFYWHSGYWHWRYCSNQWKHSEVVGNSKIEFFIGALSKTNKVNIC